MCGCVIAVFWPFFVTLKFKCWNKKNTPLIQAYIHIPRTGACICFCLSLWWSQSLLSGALLQDSAARRETCENTPGVWARATQYSEPPPLSASFTGIRPSLSRPLLGLFSSIAGLRKLWRDTGEGKATTKRTPSRFKSHLLDKVETDTDACLHKSAEIKRTKHNGWCYPGTHTQTDRVPVI